MVRVAHAQPRTRVIATGEPGLGHGQRRLRRRESVVVLADDGGHRALSVLVADEPGGISIQELLERPADDVWTTASIPEELAVRLAEAAGGRVTGVEIYPVTHNPEEVNAATCAARVELGARHVTASVGQGLRLAVVAASPVRVDGALLDRLAVPVQHDDPAAPFWRTAAGAGQVPARAGAVLHVPVEPGERPRFEPRNMRFADGLDRWHLDAAVRGDYSVAVEASCANLSSAVPEPSGRGALLQTIFADDFRGAPVVFRAELRAENVAGSAALCLGIRWGGKGADHQEERAVTAVDCTGWCSGEVSALIPETAELIQFGVVLSGTGQVLLRNPELLRDDA